MKKLVLHVGCGKTGSSALQVWLSQITDELRAQRINYPLHNQGVLDDYTISSGNGVKLLKAIRNKKLGRFFADRGSNDQCDTVLYSSESLQSLTREESDYLLQEADSHGYRVHIIAYVRDVYDIAYSSFQQLVKRHSYTKTFADFALSRTNLQQFTVVRKLSGWFEHLHLVHYDTMEGGNISVSFCRELGIDHAVLPEMTDRRVNRSLTVYETELMRFANRVYMDSHANQSMRFSASLSDQMIARSPEIETEIIFDQGVLDYLAETMGQQVEFINSRFFDEPRLEIFRKEGKKLVEQVPLLPEDLKRFLTILLIPHLSVEDAMSRIELLTRKFIGSVNKRP